MSRKQIIQRMQQEKPISPTEALRRNLLYQMLNAVSGDDMGAIVAKQVEKAKSGDGKAARLIIDMVQAGGSQGDTTHMQQAIVVDPGQRERTIMDVRRDVVMYLADNGPTHTEDIAKGLRLSTRHTLSALDDPLYFTANDDGWQLTEKAHKEVLRGLK